MEVAVSVVPSDGYALFNFFFRRACSMSFDLLASSMLGGRPALPIPFTSAETFCLLDLASAELALHC